MGGLGERGEVEINFLNRNKVNFGKLIVIADDGAARIFSRCLRPALSASSIISLELSDVIKDFTSPTLLSAVERRRSRLRHRGLTRVRRRFENVRRNETMTFAVFVLRKRSKVLCSVRASRVRVEVSFGL